MTIKEKPTEITNLIAKAAGITDSELLDFLRMKVKQAMVESVIDTKEKCLDAVISVGGGNSIDIVEKIEELVPTTSISAGVMD